MSSFWNTLQKDVPRKIVMQKRQIGERRSRVVKTAFLLPAAEALCAKVGYANGLLGPNTDLIVAERDKKIATKAKRSLEAICEHWTPRFWTGPVHKLALTHHLHGTPLDFAYLDFCAPMNPDTAEWVHHEVAECIAEGGTIGLTLSRHPRHNNYMKWWNNSHRRRYSSAHQVWTWAEDMIREAAIAGLLGDVSTFYDDSYDTTIAGHTLNTEHNHRLNHMLLPEYAESMVDALSSFMILFPYHTFELHAAIGYRNHPERKNSASMVTFVMTNFRRQSDCVYPSSVITGMKQALRHGGK
jgi:hypothetical protein